MNSQSPEGRIKAVQSKQVWNLPEREKILIMGICKFQKVFGISNLYNFFFLCSTHGNVGVVTPGGFSKCLYITIFGVGIDPIPGVVNPDAFRGQIGYVNVSSYPVPDGSSWCQVQ